jgi:hypothetical protein
VHRALSNKIVALILDREPAPENLTKRGGIAIRLRVPFSNPPEIAKPLGRKFTISNRMLNVFVAEIFIAANECPHPDWRA